jgi:DNA-binding NarL/FixJ family response regulator
MVSAHHSGAPDLAVERLAEYLGRVREVDYIRPLVRYRRISLSVLRKLLDGDAHADLRAAAESVLARLDKHPVAAEPEFTSREQEILAEIRNGQRNKEIAERLGITEEGVRYHLKKIYRKTGVSSRHKAVRYAEEKGTLS